MDILKINGLTKKFGKNIIIDNMDLTIKEHSIFGFIGKNGAGKTTTMKMIVGLLKADHGDIYVNGKKVTFGETKTNQYIGYLPDVPEFYGFMNAYEYLTLCGNLTGMKKNKINEKALELLDLVGIENNKKTINSYSRGMKQRLGIAQALLNSPKLLICDEPTSALDPLGRKEILDILAAIKTKTTVLFSSHVLSDVERICDHVALLSNGKIIMQGPLETIKENHHSHNILIEFTNQNDLNQFCQFFDGIKVNQMTFKLTSTKQNNLTSIMKYLINQKIMIKKIEQLEPTLEDLFMEVVKQ